MMPRSLVRDAVLAILRKSSEPATIRDLATAAYYFTGDDRVGYAAVYNAVRHLSADGLVEHCEGGWRAS